MTNMTEHSDMSRNVREYFEHLSNNKKDLNLQIADIASITNKGFVMEKLQAAENHWNASYRRQDYPSQDHKYIELDTCKFTFDFWKKVALLKGVTQ